MTLRVKVIPRSPRSEIVGELADGTLKVRIAAAPEHGKANEALIELIAAKYGVQRGNVRNHQRPRRWIETGQDPER